MEHVYDLNVLLQKTGADSAIILDTKGNVVDSFKQSQSKNIAVMTSYLITMATELSEDLVVGKLKQLIIKCEKGIVVCSKLEDGNIVMIISKDISKSGILLLAVDHLYKN